MADLDKNGLTEAEAALLERRKDQKAGFTEDELVAQIKAERVGAAAVYLNGNAPAANVPGSESGFPNGIETPQQRVARLRAELERAVEAVRTAGASAAAEARGRGDLTSTRELTDSVNDLAADLAGDGDDDSSEPKKATAATKKAQ